MTPLPSLAEQATAVECNLLSQQAWLRQAQRASGRDAERVAFSITCTRLYLPAFEAAAATLWLLAEIEEHAGTEAVDQLLEYARATARQQAAR